MTNTTISIELSPVLSTAEEPTLSLRYNREGRLTQLWQITETRGPLSSTSYRTEWREIPTEGE
jgi:hypothetical protein